MGKKIRTDTLLTLPFILCLALLLINDFILKKTFPGILTGKLSDFSGLFIFPYFFSALFTQKARPIYISTFILFILWKLPIADTFIEWWNNFSILKIHRTADFSDLIALSVLPISYKYFQTQLSRTQKQDRVFSTVLSLIALFSFCATSKARQEYKHELKTDNSYTLPMSKRELFSVLHPGFGYSDTLEKNLTDSLFYVMFDIPEHRGEVTAIAIITSIDTTSVKIKLDSIVEFSLDGRGGLFIWENTKQDKIDEQDDINYYKYLSAEKYEEHFEKNFIDVLRGVKKHYRPLYFDNKELIDKYIKNQ